MLRYIIQRFLYMIPTLLAVAIIVFFLIRVIPGDIVELRFAEGVYVSPEMIEKERVNVRRQVAEVVEREIAAAIVKRKHLGQRQLPAGGEIWCRQRHVAQCWSFESTIHPGLHVQNSLIIGDVPGILRVSW